MAAKITIVGGGSTHWTPVLLTDFSNTKSLEDAEVVLYDIDASSLPAMCTVGEHIATVPGDRAARSARRRTSAEALRGCRLRDHGALGRGIREHGPRHRVAGSLRDPSAGRRHGGPGRDIQVVAEHPGCASRSHVRSSSTPRGRCF